MAKKTTAKKKRTATGTDEATPVSKAEAVRRAVAAGADKPAEGVAYVKEHFGIDMGRKAFSLNKSQAKTREAKGRNGKPGRKPRAAVEGYLAPPGRKSAAGEGTLIAAIEAMKPLIAELGTEKVHRLVDLLG